MHTALLLLTLAADPTRTKSDSHENYIEHVLDTAVSFPMIAIRGGTFHQGSAIVEPGRHDNEGPRHRVELRPFWMGKYEVSWAEYQAYCSDGGRHSNKENLNARQKAADAVTKPSVPYVYPNYLVETERYPA